MENLTIPENCSEWWFDRELMVASYERTDNAVAFAIDYGVNWLNKHGEAVEERFKVKYGSEYDKSRAVNYQPRSACGGGGADQEVLYALKGIREESALLAWSEAVVSDYDMCETTRRLLKMNSVEEGLDILCGIDTKYDIQIVDRRITETDSKVVGWGGLGTILIRPPSDWQGDFATIHHGIAHEVRHKLYWAKAEDMRPMKSDTDFDTWKRVVGTIDGVSDEDLARLMEIRVCLRRFKETGDYKFLASMIDAAKFYDWVCFGRVGKRE